MSSPAPISTNVTRANFWAEYRSNVCLASRVGKVNDAAKHLAILHCDTPELKDKLKVQVVEWIDLLSTFKESWGPKHAYMDYFGDGSRDAADIDLILDSHNILSILSYSFQTANVKYISVVDGDQKIQAIGQFNESYDIVSYLATNPSNLSLKQNEVSNRRIQGAGTKILREAMRLSLIYGSRKLETFPFGEKSRDYYLHLGFTPSKSKDWLELSADRFIR